MIMRIKWSQQLKINSENEATPSASELAFTLAAAICTESLQILRTASLHPKKAASTQQPADERGATAAAARNHCCVRRTIRAEKQRKRKKTTPKNGCGVRGNLPPLFTSSKTIQRALDCNSSVTMKKTLPMSRRPDQNIQPSTTSSPAGK